MRISTVKPVSWLAVNHLFSDGAALTSYEGDSSAITNVKCQLFGLSFWRHPFTAEDPLVKNVCNAKFLQICSDEETE